MAKAQKIIEPDNATLIDAYLCYDPLEAERIHGILEEHKLEIMVRDRSVHDFPTHFGTDDRHIIAVAQHQLNEARIIITGAIEDEIITSEGSFIWD